ncbi:hypothetical protein LRS13_07320 [Svornostia abyssi]|uniref:Calcium-binding protein n=1 Tax=Svornostia abyssi TaxID=2898438 RepID=A0ABY5PKV7_9ACTN|nr:hypothetical protein LRS13_07320 [Parviterribacteraceae bacterium J379]
MRALLVLVTALAVFAPAADAATVTYDAGTGLRIAATAGERNNLSAETTFPSGQVAYVVRDTIALTPGAGCTQSTVSTEVQCITAFASGGNMVVTVDLGDQNDTWNGSGVQGETSDQFITAGPGNDTIETSNRFDFVDLGAGDDVALTRGGDDRVIGGDGADRVVGGSGSDRFEGNAGSDTLDYSTGVSRLLLARMDTGAVQKEAGSDTIAGFETLFGTPGFDTIVGTTAVDRIEGRDGGDRIYGDPAAFAANSELRAAPTASAAAICCFTTVPPNAPSKTTSPGGTPTSKLATVRTVPSIDPRLIGVIRVGDTLLGGQNRDLIFGSVRDDDINGEAGTDLVRGGDGADKIFAREGGGRRHRLWRGRRQHDGRPARRLPRHRPSRRVAERLRAGRRGRAEGGAARRLRAAAAHIA